MILIGRPLRKARNFTFFTAFSIIDGKGHQQAAKVATHAGQARTPIFLNILSGLGRISFIGGMLLLYVICADSSCSRPADKKTPPNIVLIVADTLRKDHLQVYGYKKNTTPYLSARLQNGVIFRDYYSNGSHTVSTHNSLLSGEIFDGAFPKVKKSFVSSLKLLGYRTYGVSANPLVNPNLNFSLGFDAFNANVGISYLDRPEILKKKEYLDSISKSINPMTEFLKIHLTTTADIVNEQVFLMLRDHFQSHKGRPFFLFINYLETHDPYFPHSADPLGINYNFRDESGLFYDFYRRVPQLSKTDIQTLRTLYDKEIIYLDGHLHRLWNFLKRMDGLKNTVFILTSDHGEILGEHILFTHDLGLYDEEIEVPFIVFGLGLKGREIPGLYSHINTGEIIRCLAARKPNAIGKRKETYLIHRHYVSDAAQKAFLPMFCQVDLLRITFPQYSAFYYRNKNRDYVIVRENGSEKEWKRTISRGDREIMKREIADFQGTLVQTRALSKSLEDQLRSLGYIR